MAKPTVYDELYPGRFLKAGLLKGQKVTLTISDVDLEGLEGEDGKQKQKAILSFKERPMQLVMCKTNGYCIKSMFGPTLSGWIGKRVTLFESTWNGEPCIRIWGSPDIQQNMTVSVQLPRRRPFDMVMHSIKSGNGSAPKAQSQTALDPRIEAAFGILDWNADERASWLNTNGNLSQTEMAAALNQLIEERDMQETT